MLDEAVEEDEAVAVRLVLVKSDARSDSSPLLFFESGLALGLLRVFPFGLELELDDSAERRRERRTHTAVPPPPTVPAPAPAPTAAGAGSILATVGSL